MSMDTRLEVEDDLVYPDSDGKPMAENTLQYDWITTIKGGLDLLFRDDPNVFVAADLLWYPVQGKIKVRAAPDSMVVFGRPKGYRGSYVQHREGGLAPQVVFEVLSPGNRSGEMAKKFRFYEKHGVEEYYKFDPYHVEIEAWLRAQGKLRPVLRTNGWVSPRLGIRFDLSGADLVIYRPDGEPFLSYVGLGRQLDEERAFARADRERAERLLARLRALGIDPEE